MWIVIKGDPVDGYEYVGPFDSNEECETYMDQEANETTWSIKLISPCVPDEDNDAA